MIPAQIFRLIHTNGLLRQDMDKSLLSLMDKLRVEGYYTSAEYKEALELHENDVEKAKTWLRKRRCIWSTARNGLITAMVDGRYAALAEITCKTEFLESNETFRRLAETVVSAVLNHAKSQETKNEVQRTIFRADNLKDLLAVDGKPLRDHSALAIDNMGEIIYLRRALAFSTRSPDVKLYGRTGGLEPMVPIPVSFGVCGALVAIDCEKSDTMLGMELCKHIMCDNPCVIGVYEEEEEDRIIYRTSRLYPHRYIHRILANWNAEVVDFARFEIGEDLDEEFDEEISGDLGEELDEEPEEDLDEKPTL